MGYASRSGRARTSPSNPEAFGVCDRCGLWWNFNRLRNQVDWRGEALLPLYIYVCPECWDTPQEQLRAIVIPADPLPIVQARVQDFSLASDDLRAPSYPTVTDPVTGIPIPSTNVRVTQNGESRTTQPVGPSRLISEAPGLLQEAVMPLQGTVHYGVQLPVVSVYATGSTVISVTCSSPHGLSSGDQVSVEGTSNDYANGFFNITVTTATAFTYTSNVVIAAQSILQSGTNIITCKVGLPRNYSAIPQSGV